MCVKNLVERMSFLEAFIDDMEEFSAKVGFYVRIERSIVPCNVPFSLSFVSRSGFWIVCYFVVVSTFVECLLIRGNLFVEYFFSR